MPEQHKFFIKLADKLKLFGHPDRLRMILFLSKISSATIGELSEALKIPPTTVTHLARSLRFSGVITKIKSGAYALVEGDATVDAIVKLIDKGEKKHEGD